MTLAPATPPPAATPRRRHSPRSPPIPAATPLVPRHHSHPHPTPAEFRERFLSLRCPRGGLSAATGSAHDAPVLPIDDLPTDFDWSEHGTINPVKNQGSCGPCWPLTTLEVLEGVHFLTTGKPEVLSEQQMVDCDHEVTSFPILFLNQFSPKTFIPALFGHASNDMFVQPHHSDRIHQAYAGKKNLIKFDGDHNSPRPQFYYDSVSIFFYNVLQPPQFSSVCSNKLEKYYNRGALKVGVGTNESLLYEIINGLRAAGTDAGSSSAAATSFTNATKSVVELLTKRVNQLSIKNDNHLDFLLDENHNLAEMDDNTAESHL